MYYCRKCGRIFLRPKKMKVEPKSKRWSLELPVPVCPFCGSPDITYLRVVD